MPRSISVSGVAASARSTRRGCDLGIGVPSSAGSSSASVESMPRSGVSAASRCTTTRASAWCVAGRRTRACTARSAACSGEPGVPRLASIESTACWSSPRRAGRERPVDGRGQRGPQDREVLLGPAVLGRAPVREREGVVALQQRAPALAPAFRVVRGDAAVDDGVEPELEQLVGERVPDVRRLAHRLDALVGLARPERQRRSPAVRRHTIRPASGRGSAGAGSNRSMPASGASASTSRSAASRSPCRPATPGQQRGLLGQADAVGARTSSNAASSARRLPGQCAVPRAGPRRAVSPGSSGPLAAAAPVANPPRRTTGVTQAGRPATGAREPIFGSTGRHPVGAPSASAASGLVGAVARRVVGVRERGDERLRELAERIARANLEACTCLGNPVFRPLPAWRVLPPRPPGTEPGALLSELHAARAQAYGLVSAPCRVRAVRVRSTA